MPEPARRITSSTHLRDVGSDQPSGQKPAIFGLIRVNQSFLLGARVVALPRPQNKKRQLQTSVTFFDPVLVAQGVRVIDATVDSDDDLLAAKLRQQHYGLSNAYSPGALPGRLRFDNDLQLWEVEVPADLLAVTADRDDALRYVASYYRTVGKDMPRTLVEDVEWKIADCGDGSVEKVFFSPDAPDFGELFLERVQTYAG